MASVIADTSPLQYLFQLDLLDVLRTLYGNVLAPEAVRDELLVGRSLGLAVPDPADFPWITLRSTTTHAGVARLELGAGETAALSLALEVADPIVILDDAVARTAAATLNIPSTGTLGVLLLAKQRGLVTSIASVIIRLEQRGFRIAPAVIARVLALAGE
jgi:predicted nucleic acid-binding protein